MTHDLMWFDKFQINEFFYVPCELFLKLDRSQKMCSVWNQFFEVNLIISRPISDFTLAKILV